ncbi:MAG: hypothetical protein A3A86_06860 [Elusimicrobia bacterium RIFCSPLOWO2_01_FULL_60_11]|nr:MAG: hypothetical protein A3A86_06860 [Elusimicrobia bacterium RIFCSPLOWO2_01_FULL_60_11]
MKTRASVLVLALAHAFALTPCAAKSILIFDPAHASVSEWKSSWGELPSGASARTENKKLVVTGNLANQSYGCVYRPLDIDLDKTPLMEIEVESASHHWYLVFRGDQLPNGYIKVQPDTDQTGRVQYDLRLALGLTGKQSFSEVQLGVSTEDSTGGNLKQSLVIRRFQILSADEGAPGSLQLYGPSNRNLSGWKNQNDDRSPSGVDMVPSPKSVTLRGNRPSQSYGFMHRTFSLDFSKSPVLKFEAESASHHWYLILNHPNLDKGFVRLQPDSNLTGVFYYDLKEIAGITGTQSVRLQVGVSTNEEKPTCLDETVVIKEISVVSPADVPASQKILRKADLKFRQKIQADVPKVYKVLTAPPAVPLAVPADTEKPSADISAGPWDMESRDDGLLRSMGEEYDELFLNGHAYKRPAAGAKVEFSETKNALTVKNAFYRVVLSKENGALLSFTQGASTAPVITGSADGCLWKIDTSGRKVIESRAQDFTWKWDAAASGLALEYKGATASSRVTVRMGFDASEKISMEIEAENLSDAVFLSVLFPQGLLFSTARLDRVVLPRLIGVAFKPGFFRSNKQWSDPYPSSFADYAWIGTRSGSLTSYMTQPKGAFQPASLEIGASGAGEQGSYTHRMPVRVEKGRFWRSPKVYLTAGGSVYETARAYAQDSGLAAFSPLSKKLKPEAYARLQRSPFIRVDQSVNIDIPSVIRLLKELPVPAILHLTSFWPGGFDRNYPDYLPPDPDYGTMDEFKALTAKARALGLLVMPYTNPTWWNDGPTVKRLSEEKIAARNPDHSLLREKYNENPGVVVDPFDPQVIERNLQTLKEFTQTVPMDLLFHDQIGARRWLYTDEAGRELAYTQGLIDQAARDSAAVPLMTEGGFDRLIPYETGFCGMTSLSYPGFAEYDKLWGVGNWEIYPVSAFMAHSKVNFYQHNLSEDVVANTEAKLAWNLAYGFGLTVSRTYIRQNLERKWIVLAGLFHKHLMPRILGEDMKGFLRLNERSTWSRFGDVDVIVNHSLKDPLAVGGHLLPPSGFLAQSRGADETGDNILAGYFSRLNGEDLEAGHYLIVRSNPQRIEVIQPDAKTTWLTLARPMDWTKDSRIRAYRAANGAEAPAPVSVGPDRLSILYDAAGEPDGYVLRYAEDGGEAHVSVHVSWDSAKDRRTLRGRVWVFAPAGRELKDLTVKISAWKIASDNGPPAPDAPAAGLESTIEKVLKGGTGRFPFTLTIPTAFHLDGRGIWVRARAEFKEGGKRTVRVAERKVNLAP